ncbi:MAG: AtpZ/AtpI family protein [Bacteroidetes bacterium]|nr:AtpZ/AtpI family protein [Bacteroidota bacterium]
MGLQMGATIFLFTYAGIKLDEWLKLSFPAFTISLALFSVIASIYVVAKQAMKG